MLNKLLFAAACGCGGWDGGTEGVEPRNDKLLAGAAEGGALWKSSKSSSPPVIRQRSSSAFRYMYAPSAFGWLPNAGSAFSGGALVVLPNASSSMPRRSTTGCLPFGSGAVVVVVGSVDERCTADAAEDEAAPAMEFDRRGSTSSSPASYSWN